jgi:hypothetical protein
MGKEAVTFRKKKRKLREIIMHLTIQSQAQEHFHRMSFLKVPLLKVKSNN